MPATALSTSLATATISLPATAMSRQFSVADDICAASRLAVARLVWSFCLISTVSGWLLGPPSKRTLTRPGPVKNRFRSDRLPVKVALVLPPPDTDTPAPDPASIAPAVTDRVTVAGDCVSPANGVP